MSAWGMDFAGPFGPYLSLRMACTAHRMCFLLKFKLQTNLSSPTGVSWTAMPSSGGKEGLRQRGGKSIMKVSYL